MDTIPTPAATLDDAWEVAGLRFRFRLIVGTGRYKDLEETGRAIDASGADRSREENPTENAGDSWPFAATTTSSGRPVAASTAMVTEPTRVASERGVRISW